MHGPENYIRVDMGGTVGDQVVRWHTTKPVSARSTSGTWRSPGLRKLGLLGSQSSVTSESEPELAESPGRDSSSDKDEQSMVTVACVQ